MNELNQVALLSMVIAVLMTATSVTMMVKTTMIATVMIVAVLAIIDEKISYFASLLLIQLWLSLARYLPFVALQSFREEKAIVQMHSLTK